MNSPIPSPTSLTKPMEHSEVKSEILSEFEIRSLQFHILFLSFVDPDAGGVTYRMTGQGIQIIPQKSIRIFPQVFGPTPP